MLARLVGRGVQSAASEGQELEAEDWQIRIGPLQDPGVLSTRYTYQRSVTALPALLMALALAVAVAMAHTTCGRAA